MRQEATETVCAGCRTVAISHLELDLGKPLGGWSASLEARGVEVTTDDVGRPSITREAFGGLVAERVEEARRRAEDAARLQEEAAQRKTVRVAPPAQEGMSPVEAMISQDPAFQTPEQEFSRFPGGTTTELLDGALAEGRRQQAVRRAETAEKRRIAEAREKAAKAKRAADKALGEKR